MSNLHFGRVKWFGGTNHKTNRENNYGFIEGIGGPDIYLHKRELFNGGSLSEGEILVFRLREDAGRTSAVRACRLSDAVFSILDVFDAFCKIKDVQSNIASSNLFEPLLEAFVNKIFSSKSEELDKLRVTDAGLLALELVFLSQSNLLKIYRASELDWVRAYERLAEPYGEKALLVVPWQYIPEKHFPNEEQVASVLNGLGKDAARELALKNIDSLSPTLIFYLCLIDAITAREQVGRKWGAVVRLIDSLFRSTATTLPPYIKSVYELEVKPRGGYRKIKILWDIIEPYMLKHYLYEKNPKYIELYDGSQSLSGEFESFVLFNLLSLLHLNNSKESVVSVFSQRLWERLTAGQWRLEDLTGVFDRLFPSCSSPSLGRLSCEAVYWEKNDLFLCRGKVCISPRVLPDLSKHYLDFTVYEWLAHYGISYDRVAHPSNKDFPIKLAGYFNRLREIFPVLHCRECSGLMVPNFKYARTLYREYEDGRVVEKEMVAAYRLTVFHCNNSVCGEYELDYYINHCIGFGCYSIIDSRDLKVKCGKGRYVCRDCGSCCQQHMVEKPVGICAGCGSDLKLLQSKESDYLGRKLRKARCSSVCGFEIGESNLPQKFFSPGVTELLEQ